MSTRWKDLKRGRSSNAASDDDFITGLLKQRRTPNQHPIQLLALFGDVTIDTRWHTGSEIPPEESLVAPHNAAYAKKPVRQKRKARSTETASELALEKLADVALNTLRVQVHSSSEMQSRFGAFEVLVRAQYLFAVVQAAFENEFADDSTEVPLKGRLVQASEVVFTKFGLSKPGSLADIGALADALSAKVPVPATKKKSMPENVWQALVAKCSKKPSVLDFVKCLPPGSTGYNFDGVQARAMDVLLATYTSSELIDVQTVVVLLACALDRTQDVYFWSGKALHKVFVPAVDGSGSGNSVNLQEALVEKVSETAKQVWYCYC